MGSSILAAMCTKLLLGGVCAGCVVYMAKLESFRVIRSRQYYTPTMLDNPMSEQTFARAKL